MTNVANQRSSEPARPTKQTLSRELFLTAALRVIDRDGLDKLTMRKLGAELGVDPMAVYYYLPNKSALFDGLTELIWSRVDLDSLDSTLDWTEQIAEAMQRFRAGLLRHPRAVLIVGTRSVATPAALALVDRGLAILMDGAGLSGAVALNFVNVLAGYTIGHVLAEVGEPVGGAQSAQDVVGTVTAETAPRLAKALADGWGYDPDAQFTAGLDALITGWRLLAVGTATPPR